MDPAMDQRHGSSSGQGGTRGESTGRHGTEHRAKSKATGHHPAPGTSVIMWGPQQNPVPGTSTTASGFQPVWKGDRNSGHHHQGQEKSNPRKHGVGSSHQEITTTQVVKHQQVCTSTPDRRRSGGKLIPTTNQTINLKETNKTKTSSHHVLILDDGSTSKEGPQRHSMYHHTKETKKARGTSSSTLGVTPGSNASTSSHRGHVAGSSAVGGTQKRVVTAQKPADPLPKTTTKLRRVWRCPACWSHVATTRARKPGTQAAWSKKQRKTKKGSDRVKTEKTDEP